MNSIVHELKVEKARLDYNTNPAIVGYSIWNNTIAIASIVTYYERKKIKPDTFRVSGSARFYPLKYRKGVPPIFIELFWNPVILQCGSWITFTPYYNLVN